MTSDTQQNPKPDWKGAALVFLVCAALLGGIELFSSWRWVEA